MISVSLSGVEDRHCCYDDFFCTSSSIVCYCLAQERFLSQAGIAPDVLDAINDLQVDNLIHVSIVQLMMFHVLCLVLQTRCV